MVGAEIVFCDIQRSPRSAKRYLMSAYGLM